MQEILFPTMPESELTQVGGEITAELSPSDDEVTVILEKNEIAPTSESISADDSTIPSIGLKRCNEGDIESPENAERRLVDRENSSEIAAQPELVFNQIDQTELPVNRNFHRRQWQSTFSLQHNLSSFGDLTTISDAVDNFYENFMQTFSDEADPSDRLTVSVDHHSVNPAIYINFLRKDFNREEFSSRLKVAQSNKDLLKDGEIFIIVRLVKNIGGQGYPSKRSRAPTTALDCSAAKELRHSY